MIKSDFMQDSLSGQLNGSLEAIDESPAKTHCMPKHGRLSYASAKFDKTARAIKHHNSSAIGAPGTEISLPSEEPSGSVGIEQKAKDLDQVMVGPPLGQGGLPSTCREGILALSSS